MEKLNQGKVIFSNKLELLLERLSQNLFNTASNPFSKRLIIVPSQEIKKWIQMQLAEQLKVATGLDILFLDEAICSLYQVNDTLPTYSELIVKIETELPSVAEEYSNLKKYLDLQKPLRGISLAKVLAKFFQKYGVYGKACCKKWELNPKGWQELLWKKTFEFWNYPLRLYKKVHPFIDQSIHLFAFSHISPLHFHLLEKASSQMPIHFYQFSPCLEFWSDLTHDDEMHPLLVSLGKVGQKMAKQIEESTLETEELYASVDEMSQLQELQASFLNLTPCKEKNDDSIQVHAVSTVRREIEILYQHLLNVLETTSIQPHDVLVMAPDITLYVPYILAFFQDPLSFQIADMPLQKREAPFFLLLQLEKKRWAAPFVLSLFSQPSFAKKKGWGQEELRQIRTWVQRTGIRWGVDQKHRDHLLQEAQCTKGMEDAGSTWKQGLGFLLEELAFPHEGRSISLTSAELLGDFFSLIDQLSNDLQELYTKKNLHEWSEFFCKLYSEYFTESEESGTFLQMVKHFGQLIKVSDKPYSFSAAYTLFETFLSEKKVTLNANHLNVIRFSSLLPMRAIPAKMICLLGMNQEVFPRKDKHRNLDLLSLQEKELPPTTAEFDRYLFLEAILSANERFYVSYQGFDPYDQTEIPPSSVVTELLTYLNKQPIKHPFKNYDRKYFEKNSFFKNFSKKDFFIATRSFKTTSSLFTENPAHFSLPQGEYVVDISDLSRAARYPLRHFLHHLCNIKFQNEEKMEREEEFFLSPLKKGILKRYALGNSLEKMIKKGERESHYPIGYFKKLSQLQLKEIAEELLPYSSLETSTVHLMVDRDDWEEVETGMWQGPPLQVMVTPQLQVMLVGKIEGISSAGLLVFEKATFPCAIKTWPMYLIFHTLPMWEKKALVFLNSNDQKPPFFSNPQSYLVSFLRYYFLSREILSPLVPDWVESFIEKNEKKLEQLFLEPKSSCLQWFLREKTLPRASLLIEPWHATASGLFMEMKNAWF